MIKLQLKDSYPQDSLSILNITIVKKEPRSYSIPEKFLKGLAKSVPAIMLLETKDDAIVKEENIDINEMVETKKLDNSFIEAKKPKKRYKKKSK